MQRSLPRFLIAFVAMVAAGTALILLVPAALDPLCSVQVWVPIALGAVFLAAAVLAALVRPSWRQH